MGAFSSVAFAGIGKAFTGAAAGGIGHITAHAIMGGVLSTIQGSKFGHGFLSAGFTKLAMSGEDFDYDDISSDAIAGRTVVAALIGGTSSVISGGKFVNGANTATMAHLFNQVVSNAKKQNNKITK